MNDFYVRCRYWPDCAIHAGQAAPRHFSNANRYEMAELHEQGWLFTEIAADFGTHPGTVSLIVRKAST